MVQEHDALYTVSHVQWHLPSLTLCNIRYTEIITDKIMAILQSFAPAATKGTGEVARWNIWIIKLVEGDKEKPLMRSEMLGICNKCGALVLWSRITPTIAWSILGGDDFSAVLRLSSFRFRVIKPFNIWIYGAAIGRKVWPTIRFTYLMWCQDTFANLFWMRQDSVFLQTFTLNECREDSDTWLSKVLRSIQKSSHDLEWWPFQRWDTVRGSERYCKPKEILHFPASAYWEKPMDATSIEIHVRQAQ